MNYGRHFFGNGFTKLTFEVPAVFNLDEDIQFKENLVPESFRSYFVTSGLRANVFANPAVSLVQFGWRFRSFQSEFESGIWRPQSCQIKYDGCDAVWLRPGRSRVEELLDTRRSPRLLVGHTKSQCRYGQESPAQLFCGWRRRLALRKNLAVRSATLRSRNLFI